MQNGTIIPGYKVKVRERFIEPFMEKMGVTSEGIFPVVGVMEDRLLLQVEDRFLEMYPRKVEIVESAS